MDAQEALEISGLSQIGRGVTMAEMLGSVGDYIKVRIFPKGKKVTDKIKETVLYPISRKIPGNYNEFSESANLNFFPPNMQRKALFGSYLDALNMYNKKTDQLYMDKDGNLYEWDGSNVITKLIFDEDLGFKEGDISMPNVKEVIEMRLERAKEKMSRQKRALARDIKRRYDGPAPGDHIDYTKEAEDPERTEYIERSLTDEEYRKEFGFDNVEAYKELSDMVNYDNWKYNLGSKSFTEYDLQDIENQIKLLEALSDKDIRKICHNTINKFIQGEEVTVDNIYDDLVRVVGGGPLPWNDMVEKVYKAWDKRNLSSIYAERAALLPGAAPSKAQLVKDRAKKLASYSTLAGAFKLLEKVGQYIDIPVLPKISGFINQATGFVGGTAGLYGSLFVGGGLALVYVASTIYKLFQSNKRAITSGIDVKQIEDIVTKSTEKAIESFYQKLIEAAKIQKKEAELLADKADDQLDIALRNRDPSRPEQSLVSAFTPEFYKSTMAQSKADTYNKFADNLLIAADDVQKQKNPMSDTPRIEYNGDVVIFRRGRESVRAFRNVPRDLVEEMKIKFGTPARMKGYGSKYTFTQIKNKPALWLKVNAARIAYMESILGSPVLLREPGKPIVENITVNTDAIIPERPNNLIPIKPTRNFIELLTEPNTISAFSADLFNRLTTQPNWKPDFRRLQSGPRPPSRPAIAPKRHRVEEVDDDVDEPVANILPDRVELPRDPLARLPIDEDPFAIRGPVYGPDELRREPSILIFNV